eukprot:COSAG01_NODE_1275_length_10938_cov_100.784482_2_plen_187_part_00
MHEGDGGLCVVPGGHRTGFKYPTGTVSLSVFLVFCVRHRLVSGGRLIALTICVHAAMMYAGMFYPPGAEPRDSADRRKLGFVQVTARAGDCIIMPLRLCHAVLPWIPSERDRVVLFYNFIPQFYHVRAGCRGISATSRVPIGSPCLNGCTHCDPIAALPSLGCACATHDKNQRSSSSGTMCEVGIR